MLAAFVLGQQDGEERVLAGALRQQELVFRFADERGESLALIRTLPKEALDCLQCESQHSGSIPALRGLQAQFALDEGLVGAAVDGLGCVFQDGLTGPCLLVGSCLLFGPCWFGADI